MNTDTKFMKNPKISVLLQAILVEENKMVLRGFVFLNQNNVSL